MNINDISNDSSFKDIDDSQNLLEKKKKSYKSELLKNLCLTEEEENCNILTEIDESTKIKNSMFPEYNFEKTHQTLTTTRSNKSTSRSKIAGSQLSPDSTKSNRQKNQQEHTKLQIQINNNNKQQVTQSEKSSPNSKYFLQSTDKYFQSPSDIYVNTDRTYQQQQNDHYILAQTERNGYSQDKSNQQMPQQKSISQYNSPQQISQKPQQTYINPQNSSISTSNNMSSTQNNQSQQSPQPQILNFQSPQNTIKYPSILNINTQSQSITTVFPKNNQLQNRDSNALNATKQPSIIFKNQNQSNVGLASNTNLTQSIVDNFSNGAKSMSQTIIPPIGVRKGSNQTFGSNQNLDDMSATKVNFNKHQHLRSQNSFKSNQQDGINYPTDMSQTVIFKQQPQQQSSDQITDNHIKSIQKMPSRDKIQFLKDSITQSQMQPQPHFMRLGNQPTAEFLAQPMKGFSKEFKTGEINFESQQISSMGQTLNYKQLNQMQQDSLKEEEDSNKTYKPKEKIQSDQNAMSTTIIFKNPQQKFQYDQPEYKHASFSNIQKNFTESIFAGQNQETILNQKHNAEIFMESEDQIVDVEENCQVSYNKFDQAEIFQPSKDSWLNMKSLTSRSDNKGLYISSQRESQNQQGSFIKTGIFNSQHDAQQIFDAKETQINLEQFQMQPLNKDQKQISFGNPKFSEDQSQPSQLKSKKQQQIDPPYTTRNYPSQLSSPKQAKLNQFFPSYVNSESVTIVSQRRTIDFIDQKEEGTIIMDQRQNRMNILNQNKSTTESQEMDPKQQTAQSQSPTNGSDKLIMQKISQMQQKFVYTQDDIDQNNPKGEKKKQMSNNKDNSTSGFFNQNRNKKLNHNQFSGSSANSSSSNGNQNQYRKNDKMCETLSIRIDPGKSLLEPKYYTAASQILHVSEITGLKHSVYVTNNLTGNLAANINKEETQNKDNKDKKHKGFQPIQNSDWIPYFKDKQNETNDIKNSQDNGGDQNYYVIMRKLGNILFNFKQG